MSKHTPGPWTVHGFNNADEVCGIMSGTVTADGKHINSEQVLPFFDCDPQGMHYERHMADKALIEACPELLRMLHVLNYHVGHYASMQHAHSSAHKDCADARALIAKATSQPVSA